jgi:hypothetical protein
MREDLLGEQAHVIRASEKAHDRQDGEPEKPAAWPSPSVKTSECRKSVVKLSVQPKAQQSGDNSVSPEDWAAWSADVQGQKKGPALGQHTPSPFLCLPFVLCGPSAKCTVPISTEGRSCSNVNVFWEDPPRHPDMQFFLPDTCMSITPSVNTYAEPTQAAPIVAHGGTPGGAGMQDQEQRAVSQAVSELVTPAVPLSWEPGGHPSCHLQGQRCMSKFSQGWEAGTQMCLFL